MWSANFFERITADHYVFSGDGEHGNPEREALEMLFAARGSAEFTVHLTYPVKEIDEGRRSDWNKEQKKKENRKKTPSDYGALELVAEGAKPGGAIRRQAHLRGEDPHRRP